MALKCSINVSDYYYYSKMGVAISINFGQLIAQNIQPSVPHSLLCRSF